MTDQTPMHRADQPQPRTAQTVERAVVALARQALRPPAIAEALGMRRDSVERILGRVRAAGVDIGKTPRFAVSVPPAITSALRPAAQARDITIATLITRLLAVLATEPALIDSILDDGEDDA